MGVIGLEQPHENIANSHFSGIGNAEYDADIREVIDAWDYLDGNIRAAVLAIVRANAVLAAN
jgi:ABC-type transporter Mla maintaining outer membrane lipid asymmetry permease subunit MlaE